MSRASAPEPEELLAKKRALYREQKELLELFLRNGAISEAQFRKSFGDLTEKMEMEAYLRSLEEERVGP